MLVRLLVQGSSSPPEADTIPFAPLLTPLIEAAEAEISQVPGWTNRLAGAARESARRQLWQSLSEHFGLPLLESLDIWRSETTAHEGTFEDFTAWMRDRGFTDLFARYPVLARTGGQLWRRWIVSYTRFLMRVDADAARLRDAFLDDAPLDIEDLRYGLSDPHGEGDAVLELCLRSGRSLFYKPRSLATDTVVQALLTELERLDSSLDLRIPRFVDRNSHGWVEGMSNDACRDETAVRRYFWRAGAWLGCFHLLNASDMHMENILACGEHPIPVDCETIFQALSTRPRVMSRGGEAHWCASRLLEESVLAVGMLPGHMLAEKGASISVGGLEPSRFEVKRIKWSQINRVGMSASIQRQSITVESNLPRIGHTRVALDGYQQEILDGLRRTLELATQHKRALLSWLRALNGHALPVRRVVRPTRFYYLLLRRLADHRSMTDGVSWSLQTELIARLYDWDDMDTQPWKLFRQERADLCGLSVPAFFLNANHTVACGWRGPVTNLHAQDGLSVTIQRLEQLSPVEIARQCAFAATALNQPVPESPLAALVENGRDLVGDIVGHLHNRAVTESDSAAWLGLEYLDHRRRSQIVPIGYDLYNGALGIALFLAAAARMRKDGAARDLARQAVAPIIGALISNNRKRLPRIMGLGGFLGIGSLVYGLATYAELTDGDDHALEAAALAADLIDLQTVEMDDRLDLISGSAGAILGLLKLNRLTGNSDLIDRAATVGELLLRRPRAPEAPWSSPIFTDQPLTGLSHGASGFALAFARLDVARPEARFASVVADCLAFERVRYENDVNNWQDTRPEDMRTGTRSPNQWCYGATGIGYARIGLAELATGPARTELTEELRSAVNGVLAIGEHSNDTLCCGVAGHADFLAAAGAHLGDPSLTSHAKARIATIEERWARQGDVRWDLGTRDFNLGLMRGLAGIGYAALRVEDAALPRVLVLD